MSALQDAWAHDTQSSIDPMFLEPTKNLRVLNVGPRPLISPRRRSDRPHSATELVISEDTGPLRRFGQHETDVVVVRQDLALVIYDQPFPPRSGFGNRDDFYVPQIVRHAL